MYDFDAQIVDVYSNVLQDGKKNIVILDQSAFYPTSGGQANDTGTLTIQAAALTVESSNEQLSEALERHGRARGIDEMDMTFKIEAQLEKADTDPALRAKLVKYLNRHSAETYNVVDCTKVGAVVFHIVDRELPGDVASMKGSKVKGQVDRARRAQL